MCVNVHTIVGRLRETGDEVEAMGAILSDGTHGLEKKEKVFFC